MHVGQYLISFIQILLLFIFLLSMHQLMWIFLSLFHLLLEVLSLLSISHLMEVITIRQGFSLGLLLIGSRENFRHSLRSWDRNVLVTLLTLFWMLVGIIGWFQISVLRKGYRKARTGFYFQDSIVDKVDNFKETHMRSYFFTLSVWLIITRIEQFLCHPFCLLIVNNINVRNIEYYTLAIQYMINHMLNFDSGLYQINNTQYKESVYETNQIGLTYHIFFSWIVLSQILSMRVNIWASVSYLFIWWSWSSDFTFFTKSLNIL